MADDRAYLRSQAIRCRNLAGSSTDEKAARTLRLMAEEYDAGAKAADGSKAGETGPAAREPLISEEKSPPD